MFDAGLGFDGDFAIEFAGFGEDIAIGFDDGAESDVLAVALHAHRVFAWLSDDGPKHLQDFRRVAGVFGIEPLTEGGACDETQDRQDEERT